MPQKLWENNVRKVMPYVAGEQPKDMDIIKINTNENPYPPSPMVKKALEEFNYEDLKLYPDTSSSELVEELSKFYNVKTDELFIGVGSDDVLSTCFLTFFNSDKPVLFPDITYSFYDVWADVYKIPYKQMPLNDKFEINIDDYKESNGGVIFPNPNAPTGVLVSTDFVEQMLNINKDVVVIVDEAYIDFGGKSVVNLINNYDNLLVVQTFSKSRSMAGGRIGVAIGNKKLISYLNDVRNSINSYTMNCMTQACGVASVKDNDYFNETIKKIINTREKTKKELKSLGFKFPDSMSNFIFATHKDFKASFLFEELKKRKIYVRYWSKGRLSDYLRISIGTDEQMEKVIKVLKEIMKV